MSEGPALHFRRRGQFRPGGNSSGCQHGWIAERLGDGPHRTKAAATESINLS